MDEVITCTCGCHAWKIGTGGVRCSVCGEYLYVGEVEVDVRAVNKRIHEAATEGDDPT